MPDESNKSARAADDQENLREVCCIGVEKEPGTFVGHLPHQVCPLLHRDWTMEKSHAV